MIYVCKYCFIIIHYVLDVIFDMYNAYCFLKESRLLFKARVRN